VPREMPADAPSSEWLAPEAITKRDLGVPPTLDLVQHLRDLRRVALPAALIAVLLAGGVYLARVNAAPEYGATLLARVNGGATSSSQNATDSLTTLQASYAQALADPAVLNTIMNRSNAAWTLQQAKDRIALSPGPAAGLVQISTRGDTRAQAGSVAEQTVLALGAAVRQRRLRDSAQATIELRAAAADLNARLAALPPTDPTRARVDSDYQAAINQIVAVDSAGLVDLSPLSNPTVADTPVSPNPLRDAVVALLAAFIVLAELMAAVRGRIGSKLRVVAARRIASRYGAGVQEVGHGHGPDAATIRTELLAARLLDAGADVLVLRGPGLSAGTGLDLAGLRPEPALGSQPAGGARRGRVVELNAEGQWWRSTDLTDVRLAVLSVGHGSKTKPLARRTLRALADSDLRAVLALVYQSERDADAADSSGGAEPVSAQVTAPPEPGHTETLPPLQGPMPAAAESPGRWSDSDPVAAEAPESTPTEQSPEDSQGTPVSDTSAGGPRFTVVQQPSTDPRGRGSARAPVQGPVRKRPTLPKVARSR